jgi:hypothetical protein
MVFHFLPLVPLLAAGAIKHRMDKKKKKKERERDSTRERGREMSSTEESPILSVDINLDRTTRAITVSQL